MSRQAVTSRQTINFAQNLFVRSNELNNAVWSTGGLAAALSSSSISGPYGGNITAWLMQENTAADFHRIFQSPAALTMLRKGFCYTVSVYIKDIDRGYFGFRIDTGGNTIVTFNLSTGAVATSSQASQVDTLTTWSETLLNGWLRIGITICMATDFASPAFQLVMGNGSGAIYTGTSKSVYIAQAQLVQSNWMGQYTETVASASTNRIRNKIISRTAVSSRFAIS